MDNATTLAEAEIRRQQLGAEAPAITPVETAGQVLDRLSEIKTPQTVPAKESFSKLSQAELDSRWNKTGLPRLHRFGPKNSHLSPLWNQTLTDFEAALGKKQFLNALIGPRGTGKTQMAADLLRHQIYEREATGRYISAMEFFMAIKEGYRNKMQSEEEILLSFRQPALLIIDEITVRSDSAWENMLLTHLIDKRYGSQTDTLLIGNCKDASEVVSCVGPSIASRIQECGSVIECNWPSFRAKP
jgi:hypothetical protein